MNPLTQFSTYDTLVFEIEAGISKINMNQTVLVTKREKGPNVSSLVHTLEVLTTFRFRVHQLLSISEDSHN